MATTVRKTLKKCNAYLVIMYFTSKFSSILKSFCDIFYGAPQTEKDILSVAYVLPRRSWKPAPPAGNYVHRGERMAEKYT